MFKFPLNVACADLKGTAAAAAALRFVIRRSLATATGVSTDFVSYLCNGGSVFLPSLRRHLAEKTSTIMDVVIQVPDTGNNATSLALQTQISINAQASGSNGVLLNLLKAAAQSAGVLTEALAEQDPVLTFDVTTGEVTITVEEAVPIAAPPTADSSGSTSVVIDVVVALMVAAAAVVLVIMTKRKKARK